MVADRIIVRDQASIVDGKGNRLRNAHIITIPYAEYVVEITVVGAGVSIETDDIKVMKEVKLDASITYEDVTTDFVTKFSKHQRIKPNGGNLMTIMAVLFNTVNGE